MKFIFLLGGALGFGLVLVSGWLVGREPDALLRDAAIGCLVGAFLLRWFWGLVLKAWHQTLSAHHDTMRAAEEAEQAAAAAKRLAVRPATPPATAAAAAIAPALARAR